MSFYLKQVKTIVSSCSAFVHMNILIFPILNIYQLLQTKHFDDLGFHSQLMAWNVQLD